jgi:DNA-directed RNA polymerase II subunit RPB2
MDLQKETWHVINSYFKSTPNYLAKHHIDSFDNFIDNVLPKIFKEKNYQKIIREGIPDDIKLLYQADIYIGGKLANKIYISKPTIYDHETQKMRILYPNEARLKNITYGTDVYFDIEVDYSLLDIETNKYVYKNIEPTSVDFMKNKFLTRIPIMVGSKLCSLHGLSDIEKQNLGESKYDPGGYFIYDGREKVLICQEERASNKMFLHKSQIDKIDLYVEVKSNTIDSFASVRTNRVQLESHGYITVRLGQSNAFLEENNGRDVPLFIMFRLFGIQSDKEILEYIIQDMDSDKATILTNMLYLSMNDPFILEDKIYDTDGAINYLEGMHKKIINDKESKFSQMKKNKQIRMAFLYNIIYENFLPHMGNNFREKAFYLAEMTRQLLLFKAGLVEETVKDKFNNKRIVLSGDLLRIGFRNALREFCRKLRVNISTKYTFESNEYNNENFINIINENSINSLFDSHKFHEHFEKQLKVGNIQVGPNVTKKGVFRTLERLSYFDDISQIRRIVDPVEDLTRCDISRRRLHATQYGCVCPIETPQGSRIGLQKGLSMLSLITFGTSPTKTMNLLFKMGVKSLLEIIPYDILLNTKIFLNGRFIGITNKPIELTKLFILLRRNGIYSIVNQFTSISYYKEQNEVQIYTDAGRFCRPLYILENNEFLIQPHHIKDIKEEKLKWNDLFKPIGMSKVDKETIKNIKFKNILNKVDSLYFKNIINVLEKNKSVIEYIDTDELINSLLLPKINIKSIEPHLQELKYTHCELHPAMVLSASIFLLPFIQNNAAPRNIFAQKQSKKAIGVYTTSFNNRFDTNGNLLHYPEKSLIGTRLTPIIHSDVIGTGINVIVAITVYDGYNQEDAIIINKKSLDNGLFNSCLYKTYEEREDIEENIEQEEIFYNPNELHEEDDINNIIMKKEYNYQKLDKFGFIKKGSHLQPNDILIGKYTKFVNDKGRVEYKDTSITVKKDNEYSIVDKIFSWYSNSSKIRVVKIRTVKHKKPIIGDKLTNRCAQKGIIGMELAPEDMPFTKDGIVPDLILNPYGYTKRMTLSTFMELLFGRLAVEMGYFGLGSPFEPVNPNTIGDILEKVCGLNRHCDTILYEGKTGNMMSSLVFMGPVYYQRLKQQVYDKLNYRAGGERTEEDIPEPGGAYSALTRQTISGRSQGGGLKIGEMERDALIGHGIAGFIKESFMEKGDKFVVYISKQTKNITIVNPNNEFEQNIHFNPKEDGPLMYHLTEGDEDGYSSKQDILGLDTIYQSDDYYYRVEIPFCMNLLIHELNGMCINMILHIKDIDIKLGTLFKEYTKKISENKHITTIKKGGGTNEDTTNNYNTLMEQIEEYNNKQNDKHIIEEPQEKTIYIDSNISLQNGGNQQSSDEQNTNQQVANQQNTNQQVANEQTQQVANQQNTNQQVANEQTQQVANEETQQVANDAPQQGGSTENKEIFIDTTNELEGFDLTANISDNNIQQNGGNKKPTFKLDDIDISGINDNNDPILNNQQSQFDLENMDITNEQMKGGGSNNENDFKIIDINSSDLDLDQIHIE